MRKQYRLPMAAFLVVLGGCSGGGGGGVGSTPSPTPAPTPTNTSLSDLRYNQTFATDAASGTTVIATPAPALVTGPNTTMRSTIQVRYDANSQSYTIDGPGRSQSFTPADIQTGSQPGETHYFKNDGSVRDYLTLAVLPYTSNTPNQYVGLGYWQRNTGSGGVQNTSYDSFVYGFDTPGAAMPKTGSAGYATDTLGFVTTPGKAPRAFTGAGTFNVDFGLALFSAQTSVTEYDLTSSETLTGGGLEFSARGHLGSGNGFTGNFTYSGRDTTVSGTIGGRFYGPGAEEMGASFSADNAAGAAVTGSLTGKRDASVLPVNLALTNVVADQLFYASESEVILGRGPNPPGASHGIGQFTLRADGGLSIIGPTSSIDYAIYTVADRVNDPRANFITYQKTINGIPTQISLYRPGSANSELALTYTSFVDWSTSTSNNYGAVPVHLFFSYGIETERSLLARRTGTASYAGIAYGVGVRNDGLNYDVRGTSHFDVDFSTQHFTGSLALNGTPKDGSAATDFGAWTFANPLSAGMMVESALSHAGAGFGGISPRFYGPDGEEIGGSFYIQNGAQGAPNTVHIAGATVAKRQ
ncbi:MAG: transferrin-binding protein-like solute binding protein [Sphingomonas sp.]